MRSMLWKSGLVGVAAMLSSQGFAADADGASIILNFPLLHYGSEASKNEAGSTTTEIKTDSITTQDLTESWGQVVFGKFSVYVSPFTPTPVVSPSYMVTDMVEVGLNIGLVNNKVDKPKDETTSNTFGAFVWAYPKAGPLDLETGLTVNSISNKTTTAVAGAADAKTESTATEFKINLGFVYPIQKNLKYSAGLIYLNRKVKNEKPTSSDTTLSDFGINLASLRLTLD